MRQSALCLKSADCLGNVLDTLNAGMPQDCIASDLKIAIDALSEIAGDAVSEEIISEVFAKFCIGK
jgi:tRNA modification GTPase